MSAADKARAALNDATANLAVLVGMLREVQATVIYASNLKEASAKNFAAAGRPLSIAITHAETALLWLTKAESDSK